MCLMFLCDPLYRPCRQIQLIWSLSVRRWLMLVGVHSTQWTPRHLGLVSSKGLQFQGEMSYIFLCNIKYKITSSCTSAYTPKVPMSMHVQKFMIIHSLFTKWITVWIFGKILYGTVDGLRRHESIVSIWMNNDPRNEILTKTQSNLNRETD